MAAMKGLAGVLARFAAVEKVPRTIGQQWQISTVAHAKRIHVPNRKTGNTSRNIRPGELTDRGATVVAGGAMPFLEDGTRPHVIEAKPGKMLAIPVGPRRLSGRSKKGGPVIFRKRVNHPGTRPYPTMRPAAKKALDEVGIQSVVKVWNEAA